MGRASWIFGIVGGERALLGVAARLEQGDPHVFVVLEHAPAPSCRRARRRASQFTMLVVRRTRSSSSMATIAITYGGGKLGIQVCSLIVNPATTPRPDTSAGAHSVEWQYGHTAVGGWRSSPHAEQRWNRSVPSSPGLPEELVALGELGQQASTGFGHDHSSVRRAAEPTCWLESAAPSPRRARDSATFGAPTNRDDGGWRCRHS